jgi:hypothetical protein
LIEWIVHVDEHVRRAAPAFGAHAAHHAERVGREERRIEAAIF